ncbi:transcriptional regulator [Microbacterium sp.]|uniref:GbsR/MarR family transcriptional regulator n=1 Tax=Microbacterium sp. TaxID=51671 RepID=UPI00281212B0|nr:transcriptional regulator [Microbacterium sp.]
MTDAERFVDAVGDMLVAWNLPRATGRVYGHLLLRAEASTAEQLQEALKLSSGAVSTAVRSLVSWGLARTISQPGSRRLLIEASGGFEQLLAASHERAHVFIRTLRSAESLAEDERAARRLADVTDLFAAYVAAGEDMLRRGAQRPAPHESALQ